MIQQQLSYSQINLLNNDLKKAGAHKQYECFTKDNERSYFYQPTGTKATIQYSTIYNLFHTNAQQKQQFILHSVIRY